MKSLSYRWYAVCMLSIVYILSYADRLALSLLVDDIKADLAITDVQISLLIGLAFAVFYAFLGVPIARWADNGNRRNLIVLGILFWSAMTTASAFADNFETLLILRIGVAVGEAALTPAALSMISDLFQPKERTRPASVFLAAGTLGATGSFVIVAAVLDFINTNPPLLREIVQIFEPWQMTFILVGLPGFFIAFIFLATIKDPARLSARENQLENSSLRAVWNHVFERRVVYSSLFLGVAIIMPVNFGIAAWFPTFLIRAHGWSASQAGYVFGLVGAISAVGGTLLLPWISELLMKKGHNDAIPKVALGAVLIGAPAMISAPLMSSPLLIFLMIFPALTCLVGLAALPSIAVQMIAPNRVRAQLVATYFLIVNLIGLGGGPTLVALASENLFTGSDSLGQGMSLIALVSTLISVPLLWICIKPYRKAAASVI